MQDLANVAWAFATANQSDAQLFAALGRTAERRLGDFNVQHLANTAWALTDSAACTLVSCCSEALGGGAGGDGSSVFLEQSDAHPKLGHISLQDLFFLDFVRVHFLCPLCIVCFKFWSGLGVFLEGFWKGFGRPKPPKN